MVMHYVIKSVSYQVIFSMVCEWFIVFTGNCSFQRKLSLICKKLSILQIDVQPDIKIAKAFIICQHSKQILAS